MVVSSYGKDSGSTRPGFEMDEFAQAYLIFRNNNFRIDVASPKGGKVDADKFNKEKRYNQLLMEDTNAVALLQNTIETAHVSSDNYDAIYILGGKGAMFDLPYDTSLQDIILNMYKREGTVISAVCHGPAVLVNVKDEEQFIVKDVEITGFTNQEEELFGKKWVKEFPFQLEDKLIESGAKFTQADFMLSHIAVSGKFVTGQNPFSTTRSAEAVVTALGQKPVKRDLYKDEKSIYLMQNILDEKKTITWAENELKTNKDTYDFPLMATYGYYKVASAKDNQEALLKGVTLIELALPYFYHENLDLALAESYIILNQNQKAKTILDTLIEKEVLKEKAEQLLKDIN
jgi:putative intracellular protease/amidase